MTIYDYLSKTINWNATGDAEFPYNSTVDGTSLRIRLNDFPADTLYTLIADNGEFNFDAWPSVWAKSPKKKAPNFPGSSRGRLIKAI